MFGIMWRNMEYYAVNATVLVPLWESATLWTLLVPDAIDFAESVADWICLLRMETSLFVPGFDLGGRDIVPPDWPIMAVRVYFSAVADLRRISHSDKCVRGGGTACRNLKWHRL